MNSRKKFLLLASLASAALACAACGGSHDVETADTAALVAAPAAQLLAPDAPPPEATRQKFTPVIKPGQGIELRDESITERNEKHKYEIGFTFPQLKGQLSRQSVTFNRAVRALIEGEVRDFKQAYAKSEGRHRTKEDLWGDTYDYVSGRYEVMHLTDEFVSLRFTQYAYGRGAAHPVQHYSVLNFDLKSGSSLKLGDLFRPGASHLQTVASYCIAALMGEASEERRREIERVTRLGRPAEHAGAPVDPFIERGAAAEADNYRAWNLAAEGILVSFAACQVDACAGGPKGVLVPYSALAEILDESGPAARLHAPQPR